MTPSETPAQEKSLRLPRRSRPFRRIMLEEDDAAGESTTTEESSSSSFSCSPPSPQIRSYFNPTTNQTSYVKTEVKVHEIGILFNYEIRHASDASWEDPEEEEEEDDRSYFDKAKDKFDEAKDYFGGLFGRGDDDEGEEEKEEGEGDGGEGDGSYSGAKSGGRANLLAIERKMVEEIWRGALEDEDMTWNNVDPENEEEEEGESSSCAGLAITDEEDEGSRERRRLDDGTDPQEVDLADGGGASVEELMGAEEDEVGEYDDASRDDGVEEGDVLDATTVVDASFVEGEVVNVTELGSSGNDTEQKLAQEGEDVLDSVGAAVSTFSGTKLLGMTHMPEDYVNYEGCVVPDSTCTAIRGRISVAYAGVDEYGVVRDVIERLRDGMDGGAFFPRGSPALNLEFQSAGGTAPSGGHGMIIPMATDRGMGSQEEEEGESGDLSEYGTLFVCLVGILGGAVIASMYVRYRKRKRRRREKQLDEIAAGFSEGDYEAEYEVPAEPTDKTSDADGYPVDSQDDSSPGMAYPADSHDDTPVAAHPVDSRGVADEYAADSHADSPGAVHTADSQEDDSQDDDSRGEAHPDFSHGVADKYPVDSRDASRDVSRGIIQVELDVPQADSKDSNGEVEISLSEDRFF